MSHEFPTPDQVNESTPLVPLEPIKPWERPPQEPATPMSIRKPLPDPLPDTVEPDESLNQPTPDPMDDARPFQVDPPPEPEPDVNAANRPCDPDGVFRAPEAMTPAEQDQQHAEFMDKKVTIIRRPSMSEKLHDEGGVPAAPEIFQNPATEQFSGNLEALGGLDPHGDAPPAGTPIDLTNGKPDTGPQDTPAIEIRDPVAGDPRFCVPLVERPRRDTFGETFAMARRNHSCTQKEAAVACGFPSQAIVSQIERHRMDYLTIAREREEKYRAYRVQLNGVAVFMSRTAEQLLAGDF